MIWNHHRCRLQMRFFAGTLGLLVGAHALGNSSVVPSSFHSLGAAAEPLAPAASDGEAGELHASAAALEAWARRVPAAAGQDKLTDLLADLTTLACLEPHPARWSDARLASALIEANIRSDWGQRLALAATARQLGSFAPSARVQTNLLRAELRILESLTGHPQPAVAERARARVAELIPDAGGESQSSMGGAHGFYQRLAQRVHALAPGAEAPRFLARDTAGNEVRSTLMSGKITVVRFWSVEAPASIIAHEQDAGLMREFWDAPVTLYGATQSAARAAHLEFLESCAFSGTQLFDGPISTALADEIARAGDALIHGAGVSSPIGITDAWHRPAAGSVFVIDEHGQIRGRDVPRDELRQLVSDLVKERRLRIRAQNSDSGRSPR